MGSRGIEEIKNHEWLEDVDWQCIEEKNIDLTNLPFIPVLKDHDKNILENLNDNKKIKKYNNILEKLNRESYFINFYYKFDDLDRKKRHIYFDEDFSEDEDIDNRENSFK